LPTSLARLRNAKAIERIAGIETLAQAPANDRLGADVGKLVVQQHEAVEEIEGDGDGSAS